MRITIELTHDEVRELLRTAGEHGCGYWARTNVPMYKAAVRAIAVYDCETGEKLGMLTPSRLRRMTADTDKGVPWLGMSVAKGYFDAERADVYVQMALFGEVRYG